MKRSIGLALAFAIWTLPVRADIIEQILVKVNGDIFTKTDQERRDPQKGPGRGHASDPRQRG
jgi:hypothetical protein